MTLCVTYYHDLCVSKDGVWIGEWIYWPLTQLRTTSNYRGITDLNISQITSTSSLEISWQRLLTVEILQLPALRSSCQSRPCRTQLNSLNYSVISSQTPLQSSTELPTLKWLDCPSWLLYNSLARTTSKTLFFYCCMRVRFRESAFTEPLLIKGRLFIRLLHSYGCYHCLFRCICLATGLYATV
jgi:hypothetical protein